MQLRASAYEQHDLATLDCNVSHYADHQARRV